MKNQDILIRDFIKELIHREAFSPTPYRDDRGVWTIGIGISEKTELTEEQIKILGCERIRDVKSITLEQAKELSILETLKIIEKLENEEWILDLSPEKVLVIIDIIYNIGFAGFYKFAETIKALKSKDYTTAMIELINSNYFSQVKGRALKNALTFSGVDISLNQSRNLYKILKKRVM